MAKRIFLIVIAVLVIIQLTGRRTGDGAHRKALQAPAQPKYCSIAKGTLDVHV